MNKKVVSTITSDGVTFLSVAFMFFPWTRHDKNKELFYVALPPLLCHDYYTYNELSFARFRVFDGGTHVYFELPALFQLEGCYDIVVNCAGLANKYLIGDKKLNPNRGHLIRVSVLLINRACHSGGHYWDYKLGALS